MNPKELEQSVRALMQQPMADAELRDQLEKLAVTETSFSGFAWLFGPELYRRNRVLFRPFILSRFSTYMNLPKWKTEVILGKPKMNSIRNRRAKKTLTRMSQVKMMKADKAWRPRISHQCRGVSPRR